MRYEVGQPYFMVWYADEEMRFLTPETMVFVGKNLHPSEEEHDAWYFQDAESYCNPGEYSSAGTWHPAQSEDRIVCFGRDDLEQIVSTAQLIELLKECEGRGRAPR